MEQIRKKFNSSWKTAQPIHWREPFSSAMSRLIRRPDLSFCEWSFRTPKGVLLPGMFVRAVLQEGVNKQAILIPQQAVSRDPKGNPFTWIVDAQSNVQLRMLTLDRAIGDQWLVSSGLAPGERAIIEGMQKVKPALP